MFSNTRTHMHARTRAHAHTHTRMHTHAHIRTRTHTHTHTSDVRQPGCTPSLLQAAVFINLFVVAVFAHGFFDPSEDGATAGGQLDIGLQTAGKYIGEMYGPAMVTIWALGLLAAGR